MEILFVCAFFAWLAYCGIMGIKASSCDWVEFKAKQPLQPSKADRFEMETFTRLTVISQQLARIQGDISGLSNEAANNSDDLEALRRKLHELAGDVKRISSVFAMVPTAETVND